MIVRKFESFVVPGEKGVLISWAKIAQFGLWKGAFDDLADETIESLVLKDNRNRIG